MGYYCTVPQCTSLAGKTKNVKFHRFPRDESMAIRWNVILKRGKPYTKYSKVCSLHFTQADYNVTAMGHWKTLSKDAVPSQNLPILNPDGTVMVIRKSRTVKYKEGKKDDCISDKPATTIGPAMPTAGVEDSTSIQSCIDSQAQNSILMYRLQAQAALPSTDKPVTDKQTTKQDAYMQTDPVPDDEENQEDFVAMPIDYQKDYDQNKYEIPKDYTKSVTDFLPQTNDEYNKEAEKYALERKSHIMENTYEKPIDNYQKTLFNYQKHDFPRADFLYQNTFDSADVLRNQQSNLEALQEQREEYFEGQIKEETVEDDNYMAYKGKDDGTASYEERLLQDQVKQEPDVTNGCDTVMQPEGSPYFQGNNQAPGVHYAQRPGAELLIAKQNALAAHTQLWQNSMKRPFFYTENTHYSGAQLLHRYEDLSRILQ